MSSSFARLAGWSAIVAGIAALAYSVTFAVVVQNGDRWAEWTSTLLLVVGALAAFPVMVGLYLRSEPPMKASRCWRSSSVCWPPAGRSSTAPSILVCWPTNAQGWEYPSPTDPRGFATFLLAGVTLALFSHLLGRTKTGARPRAARLRGGRAPGVGVDRSADGARPQGAVGGAGRCRVRLHRRPCGTCG